MSTKSKRPQIVFTPNPEQIMLAEHNLVFRQDLLKADYLLPDGQGLVWAAGVRTRLTGSDSTLEILQMSKKMQLRLLLVGGRYSDQTRSDHKLDLEINGNFYELSYSSGYERVISPTSSEENRLAALIQELKPDVVLVAFGAPAQEHWVVTHKDALTAAGVRLVMVVGGSFDFLTGKLRRAPRWWQKWHLEWLYRLIQEPARWRRQLVLPLFAIKKLTGGWRTVQATPQPVSN